jgi:hypothetical protein
MLIPDLHDAALFAIRHDATAKTLECVFLKPTGQHSTLVLDEVKQFRCTDFGMQNVVLRLVVHGANRTLSEDELRSHISWISATTDGEQLTSPAEIDDVIKRVAANELVLIVLVPSWGAELAATARKVSWL